MKNEDFRLKCLNEFVNELNEERKKFSESFRESEIKTFEREKRRRSFLTSHAEQIQHFRFSKNLTFVCEAQIKEKFTALLMKFLTTL